MARILVFGGHGKVALRLAPLLVAGGHAVTAAFRNPDHRDDVAATGATPLVLDLERASVDALADAIRAHDAVVFSAGAGGGNPARTRAVDRDAAIRTMQAAEQAGVKRYVMVSYHGARKDHGVPPDHPFFPYAEAKAAADAHLQGTNLDWTILGPGRLTLEPASGRIRVNPPRDVPSRDTSRENVAQVIAAVLEAPGTIGRRIEFVDGETVIGEAVGG